MQNKGEGDSLHNNLCGKSISGLVLAAGMSTRMKAFKPLLPLKGKTIIENTIDSLLLGGADTVVVVTGYQCELVEELLRSKYGSKIVIARNPDYATTDMLRSIQIGCKGLPKCNAFFLLPGDMPVIQQSTFQKIVNVWLSEAYEIVFPTLDGYRKHPPLIDTKLVPEILELSGDGGIRQLWKKHEGRIGTVPVDDKGVWIDLDTREDYCRCKEIKWVNGDVSF